MYSNYLKVMVRNILKQKGLTAINITGLAVGMACCILILLWVRQELSFDRFHANADGIERLCTHLKVGDTDRMSPMTSPPMAQGIVERFPGVISATRFSPEARTLVSYGDKYFYEDVVRYADSTFFEVFSFPLILGNPKSALAAPYSVVLTRELAKKYFGGENPIGKLLKLDNDHEYQVTGVAENVPVNSHFSFDMLCSLSTLYAEQRPELEIWGWFGYYTYLLFDSTSDRAAITKQFSELVDANLGERLRAVGGSLELFTQPLTSIHLHSNLMSEISPGGDIDRLYMMIAIAIFILLIACINFINLATARSAGRAKEIGMRKTLGAGRKRLILQLLSETIVLSLISVLLAGFLLELMLPLFDHIVGSELTISYGEFIWLIPALMAFAILVGIVAGLYPAVLISSMNPVKVLKGVFTTGPAHSRFRKVLVVFQFAISIALIIGTITIYRQLDFMKNQALGFDKERVVVLPNVSDAPNLTLDRIKEEISNLTGVQTVSASSGVPGTGGSMAGFVPEGHSESEMELMRVVDVDDKYLETMGMKIAEGRNFSSSLATDTIESAIINETAARKFGWENPIGKEIKRRITGPSGPEWLNTRVVGVVKDFHLESLHIEIEPLYIGNMPANFNVVSAKLAPGDLSGTVSTIESKWNALAPETPFDYFFLDQSFNALYSSEERLGMTSLYLSILAIFVGCLGLLGLSSYAAERRTREISIRKVMGASIPAIVRLLSTEFIVIIVVSSVVAWPIAYYLLHSWLGNFPYRISIGMLPFVLAALLAVFIAAATVSYHAVSAARANPADRLRTE